MTLYGASLIFAILFLGVIYAVVARRVWRGESGLDGDVPPAWWFLGDATWRGVARAYIATGPFVLVFFAGGLVAEFTDAYDAGHGRGRGRPAPRRRSSTGASSSSTARRRSCLRICADEPGALAERRARRRGAARGRLRMGFFSRRKGGADPLTAFREPTLARGRARHHRPCSRSSTSRSSARARRGSSRSAARGRRSPGSRATQRSRAGSTTRSGRRRAPSSCARRPRPGSPRTRSPTAR